MNLKIEKMLKLTMLITVLPFIFSCQTVLDILSDVGISEVSAGQAPNEHKSAAAESKTAEDVDILPLNIRMGNEGWNVDELDTARDADYLSGQEKDIFLATNALRSNPQLFADTFVKEVMQYYNGKLLQYPNEIAIQTQEGIKPV